MTTFVDIRNFQFAKYREAAKKMANEILHKLGKTHNPLAIRVHLFIFKGIKYSRYLLMA